MASLAIWCLYNVVLCFDMTKLERELEAELSQSEADTPQVPEPRHVKYATVMAKNLRRGSHR